MKRASKILEAIPEKFMDKMANFLDSIDQKEEAFKIVLDREHKFELAISLNYIDEAHFIATQSQNPTHFKAVGDLALQTGKIFKAVDCFKNCDDLGSLLLIYTSLGLKKEIRELGLFFLLF